MQCKSALGNKDAQCNYKNHVIALLLMGVNVWAKSSHMIMPQIVAIMLTKRWNLHQKLCYPNGQQLISG